MKNFFYVFYVFCASIILSVLILCTGAFALDERINASPSPDGFIIPHSDAEKISASDIAELDLGTIEIAKNEIYARHGLIFQAAQANQYFKAKTWYKPDKNFKKNTLNYFEASNARLLEEILRKPEMLKQKPVSADSQIVEKLSDETDKLLADKLLENLRAKVTSNDVVQTKPTPESIKERVVQSVKPKPGAKETSAKGDSIVATARSAIGIRYKMGGASPQTGFDCSGFVMWVYAQHGLKASRASTSQRRDGVGIPVKDMKPGDIVVVKNRRGRDSPNGYHTGIYVGGGSMIHAPGRGRHVIQIKLTYMNVVEGRRLTK